MGDIEEGAVGSAMGVLVVDGGVVLDGHFPSSVINHLRVVFEVVCVEWGRLERGGFGHGGS